MSERSYHDKTPIGLGLLAAVAVAGSFPSLIGKESVDTRRDTHHTVALTLENHHETPPPAIIGNTTRSDTHGLLAGDTAVESGEENR